VACCSGGASAAFDDDDDDDDGSHSDVGLQCGRANMLRCQISGQSIGVVVVVDVVSTS